MAAMTLRNKLIIFSIIVAMIPLGIAGWNMITITQEEFKSTANDEINSTAIQIAREIDNFAINTWAAPLILIKDAIDSEGLPADQKLLFLQLGMEDVADIVSLQLSIENIDRPFIAAQNDFQDLLTSKGFDPGETLLLSLEDVAEMKIPDEVYIGNLIYLEEVDTWLLTMIIPLENKFLGNSAALAARIDLTHLKHVIDEHPFTIHNEISLIEDNGKKIFDSSRTDLTDLNLVQEAMNIMKSEVKAAGVHHYTRPSGQKILGAYAFPLQIGWVVLVEKTEDIAYFAVKKMIGNLQIWIMVGFVIAIVAATIVSVSLTTPLKRLTKAAGILAKGDFSVKLEGGKRKDEIGTLSTTFIKMTADLQHYIEALTETTKQKERAESELRLARDIQQSFIPSDFPATDWIDFWGKCDPARDVGGDFIDFMALDETHYGFVIGDVSGKGVPAALFMSMCRTLFRVISSTNLPPAEVLVKFNNKIIEFDPSCNFFITIFYGIYETTTGKFVYSTAGHNMPFIRVNKDKYSGTMEMLPRMKTMVAGMMENIPYESAELTMGQGDLLYLYTDGMTEAINLNDEEYGEPRLSELIDKQHERSAKEICRETILEVQKYQEGKPQFDDMTVFVLKVNNIEK